LLLSPVISAELSDDAKQQKAQKAKQGKAKAERKGEESEDADAEDEVEAEESLLSVTAPITRVAHDKDINAIAISPNDRLVATGSQDKCIKLWNSTDLSLAGTLQGHKRGVWSLEFSPVDKVLASASGDKTIKIWSVRLLVLS
jgi:U3 small nucleolar RNA-associated protein 13